MDTDKKDYDIVRIKNKINLLKYTLNEGSLSYLINLFVSWMVSLEITNGIDKITIQEILKDFKSRINKLDNYIDELEYSVSKLLEQKIDLESEIEIKNINKTIMTLKFNFRTQIYKLFDLNEILLKVIEKCVIIGSTIKRTLPYITNYFCKLTVQTIDSIFLTNNDDEFEILMLEYINERVEHIEDPLEKKMKKITILNNMLNKIISEKINNSDKNIELNMIELKKINL